MIKKVSAAEKVDLFALLDAIMTKSHTDTAV